MVKLPTVLWAQRCDRVFVSIQLADVEDEKITVDDTKLSFSATCRKETYAVDLEFYDNIVPNESKQRKGGREYYFDLKRKETGPYWPRLLKTAGKFQHIKIDFNRWKDEDEENDDAPGGGMYDDANLEDMMKQMGTGGGNFDPGDAPDSEDSDDEDIPDLEDETGKKVDE